MPAAELGAAAAQQRTAPPAPAPEVVEADTAFLVFRKADTGEIVMTHDINAPITVNRPPTFDDVYGMMQIVIKDIVANQTATLAARANFEMNQQVARQLQMMGGQDGLNAVLKDLQRK